MVNGATVVFHTRGSGRRKEDERQKQKKGVAEMRPWLHHHFNSLHVYCKLVRIVPPSLARRMVLYWEGTSIYGVMYGSSNSFF